jgi:serine/threonine-protein kinase
LISGTLIEGRFEIERKAGSGGMSILFRARDRLDGTPVAVKLLRAEDAIEIERFQLEASVLAGLRHPGIVRYIAHGTTPAGEHYLAMEWLEGEDLGRYLRRERLPLSKSLALLQKAAEALVTAHAHGVLHRDLKPSNIFLVEGQIDRVKLLDFGIAADSQMSPEERLTRAGFFVGTLMYVAPEALSGALVTAAADQYSLATIASYLLTGCFPYLGKTPREIFTQLLSQPPIPLNAARRDCKFAQAVEDVIMRGLAREPSRRYPDVFAFATALRDALLAPEPKKEGGLLGKMKSLFGRDQD